MQGGVGPVAGFQLGGTQGLQRLPLRIARRVGGVGGANGANFIPVRRTPTPHERVGKLAVGRLARIDLAAKAQMLDSRVEIVSGTFGLAHMGKCAPMVRIAGKRTGKGRKIVAIGGGDAEGLASEGDNNK